MPPRPERHDPICVTALFCSAFEFAQQGVAPLGRRVQRVGGVLVTGPDSFQLFVDHVTHLNKVTKAQTAAVGGWFVQAQLLNRCVGTRIGLVETLLLGQLIGGCGDWHIAGFLVPPGLHLGRGQIGQELGGAFVLGIIMATQDPEGRAANDRVLRCIRNRGVQRQHGLTKFKLGLGFDRAVIGRRVHPHAAFTAGEHRQAVATTAAVFEQVAFGHGSDAIQTGCDCFVVKAELGVKAGKTVFLGAHFHVVPSREVLNHDPGLPAKGDAAIHAVVDQLLRCHFDIIPGFGNRCTRRVKRGFVVPHNRGRAVERHRQQLTLRGLVVGHNCGQEGVAVKGLTGVFHQLLNRIDRAFGGHHGGGANFKNLNDLRMLLGAERSNRSCHGFGVVALVDRNHLVVALGRVEIFRDFIDALTIGAAHRMPPLNLGFSIGCGHCCRQNGRRAKKRFDRH
mmetsp:Transcript_1533/g.2315  ORF Transcript_1533/g.2315 Transcript_1533/m.2315 type:complete len:450 (+) Transcript_1533:617-1966(+)